MLRPYELQIMRAAGQNLRGVIGIPAAVPGKQGVCGIASRDVEFFAQNFATDGETLFRIAQCGKKQGIEARFAGDLPHDLHQSPGEAPCISFGNGNLVVGIERSDVFREKGRLITHGPGIPGGLLLGHGADQAWIERLYGGSFARQGQELGRRVHHQVS
jgi:hypothetical protein